MPDEQRDYAEWHRAYDDPSSQLSRRLRVVQAYLRRAIDDHPGPIQLISMCAGEGRDVIPVLAAHPRRGEIAARLVELDPRNAAAARSAAAAAGLAHVEVVEGDAAVTDAYAASVPADIILACGVFGNITDGDVRRTVEHLPCLCAPGATAIWTRGWQPDRDVAGAIRAWFAESGFDEVAFEAAPDNTYRVGAHRLGAPSRAFEPGVRLFSFFR